MQCTDLVIFYYTQLNFIKLLAGEFKEQICSEQVLYFNFSKEKLPSVAEISLKTQISRMDSITQGNTL
jgi:hypothetical protein